MRNADPRDDVMTPDAQPGHVTAPSSSDIRSRSDATGVLIIRVWLEPGHPTALRARIVRSDGGQGHAASHHPGTPKGAIFSATVDDTLKVVRAWLERFDAQ